MRYEFLKMAEEEQKLRDKIVIEGIETCMRMTKEDEQVMRSEDLLLPLPPRRHLLTGPPRALLFSVFAGRGLQAV